MRKPKLIKAVCIVIALSVPFLVKALTRQGGETIRIAVLDFNSLGMTDDETASVTAAFREHLRDNLRLSVFEDDRMSYNRRKLLLRCRINSHRRDNDRT